ncbi:metal-dependent hydrolase family protein [Streptomyces rugosispiralis]|uniref:Amidohydrolase family protein n=1 Tax=Streptomyces rugosispiralis TaxID=2967341 RepID=A0ABT1V8V7_9ACTN|nr:amidohydrolase family protein [Streptomyces rugosispiralis]MCQ8193833.1 amidohydrolase family protein [Streptomyces rugosispiralis]
MTQLINARLIDGTGTTPVDGATIAIDAFGRITHAGTGPGAMPAPDETVIDLGGRTVAPGFIDCHVHFGLGHVSELLEPPPHWASLATFQTAERLRRTLVAGVTTARDLGGLDAGYREAVTAGLVEGPRLQVAIRMISHTGGHADFTQPSGIDIDALRPQPWTEIADTVGEARIATRRVIRAGADVIKVCATGGVSSPTDQPDDEGLATDEMAAIVDEALRHRGRPVAAHAQGTSGIRNAVLAGVTSIEHGYGIDDETIDLMLEHGTILVPTLTTAATIPEPGSVPDFLYQKKIRWSALAMERVAEAIRRGVPIALGTDSGVTSHGHNLRELAYLVDLGLSPMGAIEAGTRVAARLLGLDTDLGTIEPGKLADLVVCRTDPLHGIASLADPDNILLVMQAGRLVKDRL